MHGESHDQENRFAEASVGAPAEYGYAGQAARAPSREETTAGTLYPELSLRYKILKRAMDLILVVLALPVLLPLLLLVAFWVRLDSPGPVFFSHRRICRHGAFFSMWKFRTMCVDSAEVLEAYFQRHPEARAEWNRTHKLRGDPRVTKVGLFLRRNSLDELPQVWNVVTGRMSLVGPRPIVAAEVEKYGSFFDFYCRVKPGVTGLWQVSGRSRLTYDERVRLDAAYVQRWTLFRDLRILLATLRSLANNDGAY